jgi:hypothetical protein
VKAIAIVDRLLEADPDDPGVYLKRYHKKRDAIIEWCNFFSPKVHWSLGGDTLSLLNQPLDNKMTDKLVGKLIADGLITADQCYWFPNHTRCDITIEPEDLESLVVADP